MSQVKSPVVHTALPWNISSEGGYWVVGSDGRDACIARGDSPTHPLDVAGTDACLRANAALIVRAVNAHAELVEALREAEAVFEAIEQGDLIVSRRDDFERIGEARQQARAILAKLSGGAA